jgi:PAS domain-containing protein
MRPLTKSFLSLFLPLLTLSIIIFTIFFMTDHRGRKKGMEDREKINIIQQQKIIRNDIRSIATDLMILANDQHLHFVHKNRADIDKERKTVSKEFLHFARQKKIYDQVRLLDSKGMELIRVNDNDGQPTIVPRSDLQSKGKRYYFQDTINLQKGEIFVSPFDLNIENGAVEEPRKPMIRIGTPIFHDNLTKSGIVILNYKGKDLLNKIDELKEHATGQIMLLNREGYWLRGRSPDEEWGFMFKNKKGTSFAKSFPEAWGKVNQKESGQFTDAEGMFTFTTIYPLEEGLKSSTGSPEAFAKSASSLVPHNYSWKLVSHIPKNMLAKYVHPTKNHYLLLNCLFAMILAFGCWLVANAKQKRIQAEQELRENEQKLKEAQQIAKMGHWEHNIGTDTLTWSEEVYRIFEIKPQQFSGTLKAFWEKVHPDERSRAYKAYTESIKNKTQYDFEHRILLGNGTEKWVRQICKTEYSNTGEPIRSLGIVHDITEIKALRGIIPICSKCHKIRDDEGYWQQVDQYLIVHSAAELSHGMCLECSDELYGGQNWYEEAKRNGEIPV